MVIYDEDDTHYLLSNGEVVLKTDYVMIKRQDAVVRFNKKFYPLRISNSRLNVHMNGRPAAPVQKLY